MKTFSIYLRQRLNIWLFVALSFYILLFSKAVFEFGLEDALRFFLILFFLLVMRLYDDLQSASIDQGKPNRIYTDPAVAKELTFVLIGLLLLLTMALALIDRTIALYYILFLTANHVLYLLSLNRNGIRYFLPVLKYPVLIWAISRQLNFTLPAVFFAVLVSEAIEDRQFPIHGSFVYLLAVIAFVLLSIESPLHSAWIVALFFMISVIVIFIRFKYSHYIFLTLFLVCRLTVLVQ